jgi:flavin reductase
MAVSGLDAPFDPAEFRRCMRTVAGAVTVITCGEDGARTGLTATAMCSLTDTPPTLLVCVNASASAHPVIGRTRRFAVNVLSETQRGLAERFTSRGGAAGEARFEGARWMRRNGGAPMLDGALASFDCALEAEHRYGSHSIFIGRVMAATAQDAGMPLLYLGGRFGMFGDMSTIPA